MKQLIDLLTDLLPANASMGQDTMWLELHEALYEYKKEIVQETINEITNNYELKRKKYE